MSMLKQLNRFRPRSIMLCLFLTFLVSCTDSPIPSVDDPVNQNAAIGNEVPAGSYAVIELSRSRSERSNLWYNWPDSIDGIRLDTLDLKHQTFVGEWSNSLSGRFGQYESVHDLRFNDERISRVGLPNGGALYSGEQLATLSLDGIPNRVSYSIDGHHVEDLITTSIGDISFVPSLGDTFDLRSGFTVQWEASSSPESFVEISLSELFVPNTPGISTRSNIPSITIQSRNDGNERIRPTDVREFRSGPVRISITRGEWHSFRHGDRLISYLVKSRLQKEVFLR